MVNPHQLEVAGVGHLLTLAAVMVIAAVLGYGCRVSVPIARSIRWGLAAFLAVDEMIWYAYAVHVGWFQFPGGLPLELCNVTLWVAVIAAATLKPLAFEVVYFAGVAGVGMALITPDLWAMSWTYPTIHFFVAHGMVVIVVLTLIWGRLAAPRSGSPWRVLMIINVYAAFVGLFDATFKTNYMYLRGKPTSFSVLDYFGPWPYYLVGGELLAILLFWLLWLPFHVRAGTVRA